MEKNENSFGGHHLMFGLLLFALTGGCASTGSLTRDDVFRQYTWVAQLDAGLADARSHHADVLSPQKFEATQAALREAISFAQQAEKKKANTIAKKGLDLLKQLRASSQENGSAMEMIQIENLEQKLSAQALEREKAARRERETQAKYEHVGALFNPNDATILRRGDDILIRLSGFQFRPGRSEIEPENFALLSNIVSAVNIFPEGKVTVSGHTDATGGARSNVALSDERANGVARFLTTVGGISVDRLVAEGRAKTSLSPVTILGRGEQPIVVSMFWS